MSNSNHGFQIGHLGADPEARDTPEHGKVITFDVATTKRWTNKDTKEKGEDTFWRRYEAWDVMGQNIAAVLKKGRHVIIWSEPRNNEFVKDGVTIYTERHVVTDWKVLDPKPSDDDAQGGQ